MESKGPQRFDLTDRPQGQVVHPGRRSAHHPLHRRPRLLQTGISPGLLKLLQQRRDLGVDVTLGRLHDVRGGVGQLRQPLERLGFEGGTHAVPSVLQRGAGARPTEAGHRVTRRPSRLIHGQFDAPGGLTPLPCQGAHRRFIALGPVRADHGRKCIMPFAGGVQIGHRVGNRRWKSHDPSQKQCGRASQGSRSKLRTPAPRGYGVNHADHR